MARTEATSKAALVATFAALLVLVAVTRLGPTRSELQVQQEAPKGEYANWLNQDSRPMLAAGVQPGSGRGGGKDGMNTNSIAGDGYMDKSWKQMWSTIPAGYKAVKKELAGYMVDGKAKNGNKSEQKASSELSSYANILGGFDAWPKASAEVQRLGKEGKTYDKGEDALCMLLGLWECVRGARRRSFGSKLPRAHSKMTIDLGIEK